MPWVDGLPIDHTIDWERHRRQTGVPDSNPASTSGTLRGGWVHSVCLPHYNQSINNVATSYNDYNYKTKQNDVTDTNMLLKIIL